jgi:fructose-bisphosphate aldolase class II
MLLALHGTTGLSDSLLQETISKGVRKVNVNKCVLDNYLAHLKANASQFSLTKLIEVGLDLTQQSMEKYIEIVGSSGKAT